MDKRMFTVDFENGVIVNVLAVSESEAVKIGNQKGGFGRPEVWESDSTVESFINIEIDDGGESMCFQCQQGEITMSNAEFCAYQEMLRGCEESLFSQQVCDDDETELESEE